MIGIDVSEHNGRIDWKAMKAWGVAFAVLRLGYGRGHLDSMFYENINGTLAAGIPAGIYYYSYGLTVEAVRQEAEFTVAVLRDCGVWPSLLPLGTWLDMEDADGWKAAHGMPDTGTITAMCRTYTEVLQGWGYDSGVYASYDWLTHRIQRRALPSDMRYWCAQWGPSCDVPEAMLWQYTDRLIVGGKVFDGNRYIGK